MNRPKGPAPVICRQKAKDRWRENQHSRTRPSWARSKQHAPRPPERLIRTLVPALFGICQPPRTPAPGTAGIDSQGRAVTHPPGPPGKSQALSTESAWLFYTDSRAALPCNLKLNHDSTEKRPVRESSHHPWHRHHRRQGAGDHRNHQGPVGGRTAGRQGRETVQNTPCSVHADLIPAADRPGQPGPNQSTCQANTLVW